MILRHVRSAAITAGRLLCLSILTVALCGTASGVPGEVLQYQKISDGTGGFPAGLLENDRFGDYMTSLGDLDHDGVCDLAVAAHWDDDGGVNRGAVWILLLDTDGTVKAYQKISDTQGGFTGTLDDTDYFGSGTTTLGDLDGDGVDDLAVGAVNDDDGGANRGAVWVLFLNTDGTVKSHQKISVTEGNFTGTLEDDDHLGSSATSLGDLDGDGVGDLAVGAYSDDGAGAPPNADRGAVWVLFLNTDGTVKSHQKISDTEGTFTGTLDDGDYFGQSVASLGDLDGDGVGDLAVGAYWDDDGGVDRGAVWVLFLNSDGTAKAHQKISGTEGGFGGELEDSDAFGASVTSLGDLDCDGVGELAVGAPFDDDGGTNHGAVWVLFLNTDGTVKSHRKISDTDGGFTGTLDSSDVFGASVASLGDLNGDGMTDIAVAASGDDDGGSYNGAVWILFLDARLVSAPSGGELWPVGSLRTVSWCGPDPVDLLLSVDGGRTFDTLRSGLVGGAFTLRVPHAPTRYALIRLEGTSPSWVADSDSFFTISSEINLKSFRAQQSRDLAAGAILSWTTEPGVEDLAGYRLEKRGDGGDWRTEVALTRETGYADPAACPGTAYRLVAVNGLGGELSLGETTFLATAGLAAWPLPYRNGSLTVSFATASGLGGGLGEAEVVLYDAAGRLVRRVAGGLYPAGIHAATWDGLGENGSPVPAGAYFLRVDSGRSQETTKVMVVR
jgi:hypothetical protein